MNDASGWYSNLVKPSFAPPSYLFGIAWGILYPIIIVGFSYGVYLVYKKNAPKKLLYLILVNSVANLLFSPIQFGLQNNILALVDILVVLITLICFVRTALKTNKLLAYSQIPYLLWVSFATILQISITWLNW